MDLIAEIECLERQIFYLDCKDTWKSEDYRLSTDWHKRLRELKAQLAELSAED